MNIIVKLFAGLRCENKDLDCNKQNEFEVEISEPTELTQLLDYLAIDTEMAKILLVNGLFKPLTYKLCDGDEVSIFPPVGGG